MRTMAWAGVVAAAIPSAAMADNAALAMRPALMMATEPQPQPQAKDAAQPATGEPAAGGSAEVHEAPGSGRPDAWTIQLSARCWYVAPAGNVRMPGSTGSMSLGGVGADEPQASFSGQVDFQADRLLVSFRGTYLNSDQTGAPSGGFNLGGMAVAAGNLVQTKMQWTCLELEAGWLVWGYDFEKSGQPDASKETQFNLWALGGGRMYDYSFDVTRLTGGVANVQTSSTYGEALLGARAELVVAKQFAAELELSYGGWFGSRESSTFDVMVALSWRPCENFAAQLGYRLLVTDTHTGSGASEQQYDGSFAGVFGGVVIRF